LRGRLAELRGRAPDEFGGRRGRERRQRRLGGQRRAQQRARRRRLLRQRARGRLERRRRRLREGKGREFGQAAAAAEQAPRRLDGALGRARAKVGPRGGAGGVGALRGRRLRLSRRLLSRQRRLAQSLSRARAERGGGGVAAAARLLTGAEEVSMAGGGAAGRATAAVVVEILRGGD
jgi:hypothetical protein